jgi:SnoaL-like domain
MVDDATVNVLRRHWEEGWNARDLETIMAPMAEHIVFSSPFVPTLLGDPTRTTIEGYGALRTYVGDALRRTPGVSYTLDATYVGTDSVILAYSFRRPDGTTNTGSDSMRVDGNDKVVEWRCHYAFVQPEAGES